MPARNAGTSITAMFASGRSLAGSATPSTPTRGDGIAASIPAVIHGNARTTLPRRSTRPAHRSGTIVFSGGFATIIPRSQRHDRRASQIPLNRGPTKIAPRVTWTTGKRSRSGAYLVMSDSRHRSCKCGAIYLRSEAMAPAREVESFECYVCGATIESWNTTWVPTYRLIARPIGKP